MKAEPKSLAALLESGGLAELGPGPRPGRKTISELSNLLKDTFGGEPSELTRALVYLWHDHLDEAHSLSQDDPSPDGSFIHGIVHRREPDYGNAKYWFHRVGSHEAFGSIAQAVAALSASGAEQTLREKFCGESIWDPFAFIDSCQENARKPVATDFLKRIQMAEFLCLLNYLVRRAVSV